MDITIDFAMNTPAPLGGLDISWLASLVLIERVLLGFTMYSRIITATKITNLSNSGISKLSTILYQEYICFSSYIKQC